MKIRTLITTVGAALLVSVPAVQAGTANIPWDVNTGKSDAHERVAQSCASQLAKYSLVKRSLSTPSAAQNVRRIPWIMSLTPLQLATGDLGNGCRLPKTQSGPTLESVLSSMSPQTRRHTEAIMALTFEQLAVGAAGHA
jgi:hypothetical protein